MHPKRIMTSVVPPMLTDTQRINWVPDVGDGTGGGLGGVRGGGGGNGAGMTTTTVCVATRGATSTWTPAKELAAVLLARAVLRFEATPAATSAPVVLIVTVIRTLAAATCTETADSSTPAPLAKRSRRSDCLRSSNELRSPATTSSATASCTSRTVAPGAIGGRGI